MSQGKQTFRSFDRKGRPITMTVPGSTPADQGIAAARAEDATRRRNVQTKVKKDVVEVRQDGDSVVLVLKCAGTLHAKLLAKSICEGVVEFDSRCE